MGLAACLLQACTSSWQLAPLSTDMQRDRQSEVVYTARPGEILFTETTAREIPGAILDAPLEDNPLQTPLPTGTRLVARRIEGTETVTYCSDDLLVSNFGQERAGLCLFDSDDDRRFDGFEIRRSSTGSSVLRDRQRIEPLAYSLADVPATGGYYAQVVSFEGESNGRLLFTLELRDMYNDCAHRRETVALDRAQVEGLDSGWREREVIVASELAGCGVLRFMSSHVFE